MAQHSPQAGRCPWLQEERYMPDTAHKGTIVPALSKTVNSIWEKGGQEVIQFRCKSIPNPKISGSNQDCIQHDLCNSASRVFKNKERNFRLRTQKYIRYLSEKYSKSENNWIPIFRMSMQSVFVHLYVFTKTKASHCPLQHGRRRPLAAQLLNTLSSLHSSLIMKCFRKFRQLPYLESDQKSVYYGWEETGLL